MKLGFGFYRHMLTPVYHLFARQVGSVHAVARLADWGFAENPDKLWEIPQLRTLKKGIEDAGDVPPLPVVTGENWQTH